MDELKMRESVDELRRIMEALEEAERVSAARIEGIAAQVGRLEEQVERLGREMCADMERLREIVSRTRIEPRTAQEAAEWRADNCKELVGR